MVKKEKCAETAEIERRSNMEVAIDSRLLGVAITIFILILTIKIELLSYTIMTAQLIMSFPFLIAAMVSNSKIVNRETLNSYHVINRLTSAIAVAFLFNTLGLMVTKYISFVIGIIFFIIFIFLFIVLIFIDLDKSTIKNKLMTEVLVIFLMIMLGILPALGYYGI